jgi:hypothetical protein
VFYKDLQLLGGLFVVKNRGVLYNLFLRGK